MKQLFTVLLSLAVLGTAQAVSAQDALPFFLRAEGFRMIEVHPQSYRVETYDGTELMIVAQGNDYEARQDGEHWARYSPLATRSGKVWVATYADGRSRFIKPEDAEEYYLASPGLYMPR